MSLTEWSLTELDDLYDSLTAGEWPVGTFDGEAVPASLTGRLLGRVWAGKVFEGETVRNRLFGLLAVRGSVYLDLLDTKRRDCYVIDYGHGLIDELRMIRPGFYLGKFFLRGRFILYFTLETWG